jgi:hypothetical protein
MPDLPDKGVIEGLPESDRRFVRNLNELAGAIGRVVITFNSLESDLSETLVKLISAEYAPELWDAFRASLSFSQRLNLLAAIFLQRERAKMELELLRFCVGKLRYYEERRNFIVHASWETARFGDEELRSKKVSTKGGKGLRTAVRPADSVEIDMLVEEMRIFSHLDFVA